MGGDECCRRCVQMGIARGTERYVSIFDKMRHVIQHVDVENAAEINADWFRCLTAAEQLR